MTLNEAMVEDAALSWFGELGYAVGHGPHIAPGEPAAERDSFGDVLLAGRLREAVRRLNPAIPEDAREEALRKVLRVVTPSLTQTNRAFHKMLRDGVDVEYPRPDGSIAGDHVRLIDFGDPAANNWFAVNQFTVIEGQHNRRPDIVVFVNGLPLGLIELKNAADEDTTIWSAYAQIQTYKAEIPSLLHYNAALVVLTDRNDLDDQLFGQFQRCADILGQTPVQAGTRDHLRELLAVASGGVVFTTIQKFLPAPLPSAPPATKPRKSATM